MRDDHVAGGADRRNAVTLNDDRLAGLHAFAIHANEGDVDNSNGKRAPEWPFRALLSGRGACHHEDEKSG
jgi:hypothetical protein